MFQEAHSPGLSRSDEGGRRRVSSLQRGETFGKAGGLAAKAKSVAEREKFSNIAQNDTGIFKLAKQMDKTNQDVVGEKCVRNDAGELHVSQ